MKTLVAVAKVAIQKRVNPHQKKSQKKIEETQIAVHLVKDILHHLLKKSQKKVVVVEENQAVGHQMIKDLNQVILAVVNIKVIKVPNQTRIEIETGIGIGIETGTGTGTGTGIVIEIVVLH